MGEWIMFTKFGLEEMTEGKRTKLNTYTLRLYKTNVSITLTTVAGDLTEANFHGYAGQAITQFGAAFDTGGAAAETDDVVHTFQPTDGVVPNTIYGWYITKPGGQLVAGALLPEAFVMDSASKILFLQPKVTDQNL